MQADSCSSWFANAAHLLAGFRTLIERRNGSLLRFMTVHHLLKSYYLVMLARPLMWLWCERRTHLIRQLMWS